MKTPEQFPPKQGPQPYSQPSGMSAGQNMPMPSEMAFPSQNQPFPPQPGGDQPPTSPTSRTFPPQTRYNQQLLSQSSMSAPPSSPSNGAFSPRITRNLNLSQTGNLNPTASRFIPPGTPTVDRTMPPRPPSYNPTTVGKILLFIGLTLLVIIAGIIGYSLLPGNADGTTPFTQNSNTKPTPTPPAHMQHQTIATQYAATMSLDDKIAQLLMIEQDSPYYGTDLDTMINKQHVGTIILYASAIVTRDQTKNLTSQIQAQAATPVLISIDEEGRSLHRLANLYDTWNYRKDADDIQATGDPNVATTEGQSVARDLLSLGMNMNLAPVIDISSSNSYIGYDGRSFGTTSDQVIKYAGPYLKAMQATGVVGTLKHFPGLGNTPRDLDPHATLPTYEGTKDQLYQTDLVPFKYFIQNTDQYGKAYVVMPTDMLVPAIDPTYPAELSHIFITDILRNQFGFQGVILTDSLHMGGVTINGQQLSLADASVLALEAGNDMLAGASTSDQVQAIITAIKLAITQRKLSQTQIDASVIRILTLKMDFNLMPATLPGPATATPIATSTQTPQ
jgi:beta-N-acetylhexosaminidase